MSDRAIASPSDIRLVGMLLHVLMQQWAGKLGSGPLSGSALDLDLASAQTFATARLSNQFSQSWTFAQTLGTVATNHEAILREALLRYANGETTTKPITVVTTVARVVLETLAVQAWLIDPDATSRERLSRWMALEYESELASWRIVQPGAPRLDNPVAAQLLEDARTLSLDVDERSTPNWIGVKVPTATELAGRLVGSYVAHARTGCSAPEAMGETFYRLFSGEIHGGVGSLLALLLPTGITSPTGLPVHAYDLSHGALWRSAALILMSTFAARCTYAAWLGLSIDGEVRRIHTHHVELSIRKLTEGPGSRP